MPAGRPAKQTETARWLRSFLAQGSRPAPMVEEAARGLGISRATLNRVKASLGVESIRRGEGYHWRDPDVFDGQQGSASLVEAIREQTRELTKAIRSLAKAQASLEAAAAKPAPKPEPELPPFEPSFERWTDDDYRDAGLAEIEERLLELEQDLADAQKFHGKRGVDNSLTISALQNEVKRAGEWRKTKADQAGAF